jgi:uncharacterized protein
VKFLLVFLVVLVIAWRWRTWRESVQTERREERARDTPSTDMISCRQCGLHLPANEAVAGKLGRYCSKEHRLKLEP